MCEGKLFHKWVRPVSGLLYRTCIRCGRHEKPVHRYEGSWKHVTCEEFEKELQKTIETLGIKFHKAEDFKSEDCKHFKHQLEDVIE